MNDVLLLVGLCVVFVVVVFTVTILAALFGIPRSDRRRR